MRKVISLLISFTILIISMSCSFSAFAGVIEYKQHEKVSSNLQNFAKKVYALTNEYDSDLTDSRNSSTTTEAVRLMSAASVENEIDFDCFETNRLIVYSDQAFDICNAVEHLSGFEDMHLLQYDSIEATIAAYEYFNDNAKINSVEPDVVVELEEFKEANSNYIDYPHDTTLKSSWGYERIQTYDAFQYVLQNKSLENLPEIVIGIVDSGILTGNKYFDDRLIGAYSFIGRDPYSDTSGHGSKVAGVILENTLPNVKIISYQVFQNTGTSVKSLIDLAEEQARLDGVDIINSSYGHRNYTDDDLNQNTTNIKNDTSLQIAAAGNDGDRVKHFPAAESDVISVAALDEYDKLTSFSTHGKWVDVAAPGVRILSAWPGAEGRAFQFDGTSCATPFVTSVCAMIMTQYPSFSNSLVAEVLFNSCEKSYINVYHGIVNMFNAVTYYDAEARQTATPQFNLDAQPSENQFYSETQYIELSCLDSNAEIYYTLDKTIPNKTKGTLYTEPIKISSTTTIYAVAYTDEYFKSEIAKRTFLIRIPLSEYPNENGWHIRDNGMIWGYSGSDMDLVVPETVLGIDVKGIEREAFSEQSYIKSITMPECLTIIEDKAFFKCNSLISIVAPGVKEVGVSAFFGCRELNNVFMSELQTVEKTSFRDTGSLSGFPFENLEKIPRMAFCGSDVFEVNLENAVTIRESAFANCASLTEVSMPKVDTENMGYAVFQNCSMLETVKLNENTVCIPSQTFDGCNFSSLDCFDTIEIIESEAFSNNGALIDITMESVKFISESAFENCTNLVSATFPNVTEIDQEAFQGCSSLSSLKLSGNVSWLGSQAFNGCDNLTYLLLNGPVLSDVGAFEGSSIKRLEMNGMVTAHSLPIVKNSIIALPLDFKECTEETKGRNYKVYGTKGSTSEKWAIANDHTFYEISQENSIVTDVAAVYDENSIEPLTFDAIGINSSYQWYGSLDNKVDNGDDVAVNGADSNEFTPKKYDQYPYYYCKMISNDIDTAGKLVNVNICSSMCQNKLYMIPQATQAENKVSLVDGTVTTSKLITFVAIGSNMNLSQIIEGSTKFMPVSWYVTDELQGNFQNGDYTVTYKHSNTGTYKLIVVFEKFVYSDTSWQSTGEIDEKTVNYIIEETENNEPQELYGSISELIFKMISMLLQIITNIC